MKKILITGANSYIGTSFEKWVSQYPDKYSVDKISVRDERWKEKSFGGYDVLFHTAAVVHVKENDTINYFKVNRDLAVEVAEKAKQEGVKQFIFLSTMGVYGTETGYITKDTVPTPKTPYAKSKYEAEQLLLEMDIEDFNVAILRPSIVYGKGCPGNYSNDVPSGLTGWAQINGRDELPIEEKAKLDGEYVNNISFWMDTKCFFGTIVSVIKSEGVREGKIKQK